MSLARFAYCTLQWVCGIQIQGLGQKYFLVFSVDWINCSVCIENFSLRVLMDEKRWEPDIWLGVWTSVHLIQLSSKKQNFIKSHTNCHFGPHLCKSFTSPFCRFFVKRSKRNCFASTAKQWRTATLRALQLSVHTARVTYKRSTVPGPKRSLNGCTVVYTVMTRWEHSLRTRCRLQPKTRVRNLQEMCTITHAQISRSIHQMGDITFYVALSILILCNFEFSSRKFTS